MEQSQVQPPSTVKDRTLHQLRRLIGPELLAAFEEPNTVELLVNANGDVWIERLGERAKKFGDLRPAQSLAIIEAIAGYHNFIISHESPILECNFPLDGSRFAGQIPPVVKAPVIAIRKKASAIFPLEGYVLSGAMTHTQLDALLEAIDNHRNILIVGGTGSGKTTLINAIIDAMVKRDPLERFVIIEDTGEIQCAADNYVQYHSSANISMTALLKTTLRMRPDRVLIGEVRGPEALDLLDAWNTGHPGGVATLHANSAIEGLVRLKSLITRHPASPSDIDPLIAGSVHVVVHITRTDLGRRIQEIILIDGYDGSFITRSI